MANRLVSPTFPELNGLKWLLIPNYWNPVPFRGYGYFPFSLC